MERRDWNDDERPDEGAYPDAPLPADERVWRHPSEIGQATWVRGEPPLTIGRGLAVATSAIGAVLALAVVWTLLPNGSGPDVTALSTVTIPPGSFRPNDSSSLASAPGTSTPRVTDAVPTSSVVSALTTEAAPSETIAVPPPPPTVRVTSTKHTQQTESPIAVALVGGGLVVTTARAVGDDTTVTLTVGDGQLTEATVLFVDSRSGLALLSIEAGTDLEPFTMATGVHPGDVVTVLGGEPVDVELDADESGHAVMLQWGDESLAEGTPVVNGANQLVGLCSEGPDGPEMITLDNLQKLKEAAQAMLDEPVRLGVVLNDDPSGALTVADVDAAGPAAAAGIVVGDTLLTIDGATITTADELSTALDGYDDGDEAVIEVLHSDGTQTAVTVTLTVPALTL